jgi:hypothetical protein
MSDEFKREHSYHSEATVVAGHLRLPLEQEIKPQAFAKLPERGGYLSQHDHAYRLEGVLSYRSAYTQVAGNRDVKPDHGWSTLSTSVVEGLNVLDVVTADRVVSQVSIEHPLSGYVPAISFLGTRFDNLRIAGHPVRLDLDLNIVGPKPQNDLHYSSDSQFMNRVTSQHERMRSHPNLPADLLKRYNQLPTKEDNLESIECSLVNQADGSFPGRSFGHVIDVPNFGKVYLATLRIDQADPQSDTGIPKQTLISLTMIRLEMGCIADGNVGVTQSIVNGRTRP